MASRGSSAASPVEKVYLTYKPGRRHSDITEVDTVKMQTWKCRYTGLEHHMRSLSAADLTARLGQTRPHRGFGRRISDVNGLDGPGPAQRFLMTMALEEEEALNRSKQLSRSSGSIDPRQASLTGSDALQLGVAEGLQRPKPQLNRHQQTKANRPSSAGSVRSHSWASLSTAAPSSPGGSPGSLQSSIQRGRQSLCFFGASAADRECYAS